MSISSHNDEVDASLPGHRRPSSTIFSYILARRLARKYKKMSPQASSSPPIRHQIIMVRSHLKNKNIRILTLKIKII